MSKAREISELGDVVAVDGSNVGIGTSSPNEKLTVNGGFVVSGDASASSGSGVTLGFDTANLIGNIYSLSPGVAWHDLAIRANQTVFFGGGSERMRIDSNGNVGIGVTPAAWVTTTTSRGAQFGRGASVFYSTDLAMSQFMGNAYQSASNTFNYLSNGYAGRYAYSDFDGNHTWYTAPSGTQGSTATFTERMRLDASGNLLVGTTVANPIVSNIAGLKYFAATGTLMSSAVNVAPLELGRSSSDGAIANFYKNGTTVGSIGNRSASTGLEIASTIGAGLAIYALGVCPTDGNGAYSDNLKDCGAPSVRWDDVYATNGTIQTSDANEKQQIAELTDAEMQAAKAISKLFKTFKWNDSVAEKGDDARIHTGVIAQEVEAAMTAAGLDAGRYAFFISSTWWESTEVIPAVEAVAAVEATYDEEGNILTEAVEAVEAQPERTVTHTHGTAEEAPAGAVERTRKGIRYPQLLAFIGAATEQRLASIEARLDALETV